jgi:hypothetical protein
MVYFPTSRLVVIVPAGPRQDQILRSSIASKSNSRDSFGGTLDATGRRTISGSIWLLIKAEGALKSWISDITSPVKTDLPTLAKKGETAKTFGCWTSPGGTGVRVGCALQCNSAQEARELVKAFQEGNYGKGDEAIVTNEVRTALNLTTDKKIFGELMQYLEFSTIRECAYMISKSEGDNTKRVMDFFNNPSFGSDEANTTGGISGIGAKS